MDILLWLSFIVTLFSITIYRKSIYNFQPLPIFTPSLQFRSIIPRLYEVTARIGISCLNALHDIINEQMTEYDVNLLLVEPLPLLLTVVISVD